MQMAIRTTKTEPYWTYFLALEDDLLVLSRYIEPSKGNFRTFSIELAHLLLAAASEVDVVMKLRSEQVGERASNMVEYREVLHAIEPALSAMSASIPRYGLTLRPWVNWTEERSPDWWSDHNAVKHQRSTEFSKANLKNVLNAMAGLFLLLLGYYSHFEDCERVVPAPTLFAPPAELGSKRHSLDGETGLYFNREAMHGI